MKAITEQEAWTMFVNTSDILKFHKERMLPELEKCVASEEWLERSNWKATLNF